MVQKRAAIYCRVSTVDQSCDRQERDLLEFAQKAGYEVVGIWKETASGAKNDRVQRKKVMALAQRREINAILVTELTRWGRSTPDLQDTLLKLQSWNVSIIAQTGLEFDLSTPQGRLIANFMCSLAEFERDLIRERIKSGLASAKARGKKIGRQLGQRLKSDKLAPKVIELLAQNYSYRRIAKELDLSKTTVADIAKRYKD